MLVVHLGLCGPCWENTPRFSLCGERITKNICIHICFIWLFILYIHILFHYICRVPFHLCDPIVPAPCICFSYLDLGGGTRSSATHAIDRGSDVRHRRCYSTWAIEICDINTGQHATWYNLLWFTQHILGNHEKCKYKNWKHDDSYEWPQIWE